MSGKRHGPGKRRRAYNPANYLSVGQIYLLDNPRLRRKLTLAHVKPRLLGHWGTTPGLARLIRQFSFPGGVPSHVAPETSFLHAIPSSYSVRHRVRRYGFHGTSHRYVAYRYRKLTAKAREDTNLITLHLGNGCSACAIKRGQSFDTSMGLTPLEGLVMGTRVCAEMDALGIELDPLKNATMVEGREGDIAAAGSRVRVFVLPTNEELLIARDTMRCVTGVEHRY